MNVLIDMLFRSANLLPREKSQKDCETEGIFIYPGEEDLWKYHRRVLWLYYGRYRKKNLHAIYGPNDVCTAIKCTEERKRKCKCLG
jgi:hypothetical protein